MTYLELKTLAAGLLTSDFPLPEEDDQIKALLGMAYNYIIDKCLIDTTLYSKTIIDELTKKDYLVKVPNLPSLDTDILEIGTELGYVAASLIASYLSERKMNLHLARATDAINSYNAKVVKTIEFLDNNKE